MAYDIGPRIGIDGEREYREQIKNINQQMKTLDSQLQLTASGFTEETSAQEKARAKTETLTKQISLQEQKLKEQTEMLERSKEKTGETSTQTQKYQEIVNKTKTKLNQMKADLEKTSESTKTMGDRMKEAGEKIQNAGAKMKGLGDNMNKYVSAPLGAIAGISVKSFNELDDAMDITIQKTGATGKEAEDLKQAFKDVAGSIEGANASFEDSAKAVGEINTRFGFTGKQLDTVSKDFLKFAQVNGSDVEGSVQAVSRAMENAGADASEYKDYLDALTVAGQKSGISIDKLSENLTKYGAPMRQLGYDAKESIAIFSQWEKSGVNVETAFTGMRTAVNKFNKEGKDAKTEFKKLVTGIKNGTVDSATAMKYFGSKAGTEMIEVIKEGKFEFDDMIDAITGSKGALDNTFDGIIDDGDKAKEAINKMKIRLGELGSEIIERGAPILEKLLDGVSGLLEWFNKLPDGVQNVALAIGGLGIAGGPAMSAIGRLTEGIGKVTGGIGSLIEKAGSGEGVLGGLGTKIGGLVGSTSLLSEALVIGGPAVLAFGAALASIGDAIFNCDKPLKDFAEDITASLPNVENYENYINSATSALSNFSIEQTAAGQHISEYDEQIRSSIGNIHTIAAAAAEESRQFTEAEWAQIQELIGAIEDYTNKKIEAYEQQQKVVASMAEMEVEMTKERSAELVKAAEDTKNQTIAIANQQYQQLLTEAETMFAAGEIEKAAYDEMRENATKAYNDQVAKANKAYADTNAIISEKFLDQNVLTNDNIKMWDEYFSALESANTDYEAAVSMIRDKERQGLITHQMAEAEIADAAEKVEQGRLDMQKKMMQEAADNWDEQTADYVSYWMTMASNTELYGGKVSDKERDFIKDFIEIVDTLPDEMKDTAKEAMEGFGQEMSNRQPSLFDKAASIAGGIINTLNKAFDIHSPSRVMAGIAKNVWAGFENETAKQTKVIGQQAADVVKQIITGINGAKENAEKSAAELGDLYVSAAKKKLSDLEALHRINEVGEVQFWQSVLASTKKGTRAYTDALIELTKAKDSLSADVTKLSEDYASNIAKVRETLNADLKKVNDDLKTNVRNVNKTLSDGIKSLRENYRKAVSDRASEIKGSMGLFDEVKIEEGLSSSELIQNLRGQVNAIKEWDGLLDTLRERISNKELLKELESQGVDSIDTLRSIAEMSDKELSTYQSLYAKKNKYATERAKTENEELRQETEAEIEQMRADAAKQIKKLNEDAEKQRKNLEKQAQKDVAALTKQYAKDLAALGVTAGTSGKDIGKQIANGIGSGFKTAMKDVKATTKNELDSLLKTIKKKLGIASPSKVYAGIGEFMAEGLGVGFEKEMKTVSEDMADAMRINRSFSNAFAMARTSRFDYPAAGSVPGRAGQVAAVDAVGAMKQALQGVKIVLDDEVAGRFVEKTVTDIVYS